MKVLQHLVQQQPSQSVFIVMTECDGPESSSTTVGVCSSVNPSWLTCTVSLKPLDLDAVTSIVAAVGHLNGMHARECSRLLSDISNGVPSVIIRCLTVLYQAGALKFDVSFGQWTVNLDDVMPFLTETIGFHLELEVALRLLPEPIKLVLFCAAIIEQPATLDKVRHNRIL